MEYTKNLYTNKTKPDNVPPASKPHDEKLAQIKWEPRTRETMCGFPDGPRKTLGYYLWLVQKGERPPDSSPVPGVPDVVELRDDDDSAWYRVIYLKRINDTIHVLHCFEKQSNRIEKRDLRTIQTRLASLNQRLIREGRNAKATRNDRQRSR